MYRCSKLKENVSMDIKTNIFNYCE